MHRRGEELLPQIQALEERTLQSSVPRCKMQLPSLLWSSLSSDSSWHGAEKLTVATGCENTLIWSKQIQHSFFYSFPFPQQRTCLGENTGWPGSSRKDARNEICQYYSLLLSKFIFISSSNTPLSPVVSGKSLATVPDISSYNVQMDKSSFLPFSKQLVHTRSPMN